LAPLMQPVLEIRNITKRFGTAEAVRGVSLNIRPGEVVGLLGANGAGKTTLMQMVLGLLTPTSGDILLFGESFEKHRVQHLARMNFCSTYAQLPGNLKVIQNLRFFARLYGVPDAEQRINGLLERFEIARLKNAVTGNLSSGESTRLNLCKALLNNPELLLLDEPTASLDPDIADKVRNTIRDYARDRRPAMLYTSHNMRDIEAVCDRILFIHRGLIVTEGTPTTLLNQFRQGSLEEVFIHLARNGELVAGELEAASKQVTGGIGGKP
jgi:ABC-2 type transport system ATP-binding protein